MIYSRLAVQRALRNRDPGLLQVAFEADVLDRYRGQRQFTIMRTDSAGSTALRSTSMPTRGRGCIATGTR